jgi:hypothetical protein
LPRVRLGDQLLVGDRPDDSPACVDDEDTFDVRLYHDLDHPVDRRVHAHDRNLVSHPHHLADRRRASHVRAMPSAKR